jgi:hypothetical protein
MDNNEQSQEITTDNLRSKGWKKKEEITRVQSTDQAQANNPDSMIMVALTSGRSMEEIKELIKMRNEEIARIAKLEFRAAKKQFLKECPAIVRNSEVDYPHKDKPGKTNFWYTDLDKIIETIKDPLANAGLSFDWKTAKLSDGDIQVTCILSHVGGHEETDTQSAPPDVSGGKSTLHAKSSTQTYLKRQTLSNVCGISPGSKDDDGKLGGGNIPHAELVKIPKATEKEFNATMKGIIAGNLTMEEACKHLSFTMEQINALKIAEKPNEAPTETQQ